MPSMYVLLAELDAIKLPAGEYAIFGSGPMAVRGWREANDLDVIVTQPVWDWLLGKYDVRDPHGTPRISFGDVDLFRDWGPGVWNLDRLIDEAELIDGRPYVQLESVLAWKKLRGKPKDEPDIKILEANGVKLK